MYLRVNEFADKYHVSVDNIYTQKHSGKLPESIFIKYTYNTMFIEESFFLRRQAFKKKIWLKAHDNYYFLERHLNVWQMALMMEKASKIGSQKSWNTWIKNFLFLIQEGGILHYKIQEKLWLFYRVTRTVINRLFRYCKIKPQKRQLSVLIDKD